MRHFTKWITVLLAVAIAVASVGCSGNESLPKAETVQPKSGSGPLSSQPEAPAPSTPAIDYMDNTALHRDILVNFGADNNTGTDGSPLEAHKGASLFQREDWDSEHPMPGFHYFVWNFGQMWNEDITFEARQKKYAHPSGKDDMGYFFPQKLYEGRAQQYFDVRVEDLRSIPEYDAANEGYNIQAGFGIGHTPQIVLRRVEQQGDVLELYITLAYEGAMPARNENKILRVRMAKDGSYKFIGYATESVSAAPSAADETAVFALGVKGGEEKTMRVGDTIGDWTLSDLEITYFTEEQKIRMLESSFTGEVTLTGTISRNGLVELGYDFMVADEDFGKLPRYISSENAEKDYFMFMLDIPDGLANAPSLEHGEELECKITISSYRFIFAYMTAPSSATVTKIEPL